MAADRDRMTVTTGALPAHLPATSSAPGSGQRRTASVWWSDAAGVLAGLTLLAVTALWVSNGGVQQIAEGGVSAVSAAGRLGGLWASDLLLLQVLLLARIPLVEHAFGQDRLARWHRWTGFTSFWLLVAHIVLIAFGYAGAEHANVFAELWDMIWSYPGMLLAAAGTAALILVVVTSIRAARRRLRYESWHLLHLYAYLGAGLALPHQLWTGTDFIGSTASTVYWWTLYAVAAGAVFTFRIGVPAWRSWRHRLVVSHVVPEGPGLTSVYLTGRRLDRLPVRAGQFFQWRFLDGPGWTRAKPYSLSAAPDGRTLRITAEAVGGSSSRLATVRPGTKVLLEGPYGRLHTGVSTRTKVLLIGAGIGITPLRAILEELPPAPAPKDGVVVIYRVGTQADIVLGDELLELAHSRGGRVVAVVGHRNRDRTSWLPADSSHLGDAEALTRIVPDIAERDVYVCGHPAWMDPVIAAAHQAGVPRQAVHHERFSY